MFDPVKKLEEENMAINKNNNVSDLPGPFKGGDDKADLVEKDSGKEWLAKKGETPEELKERIEKDE